MQPISIDNVEELLKREVTPIRDEKEQSLSFSLLVKFTIHNQISVRFWVTNEGHQATISAPL